MNSTQIHSLVLVASVALFFVTVGSVHITYFEADPFYYVRMLPFTYWIGIGLLLLTILRKGINENLKIIALVIIAIYIYGTPSIVLENPRMMDVYVHGADLAFVINNDNLSPGFYLYQKEYPSVFIVMADLLLFTGIDEFIAFNIFTPVIMVISGLLLYLIVRPFADNYSTFAPLAFFGLFFVDQGHFSPQALGILFFLMTLLAFTRILFSKEKDRNWLLLLTISLISTHLTNPTTSYILTGTLLSTLFLSTIWGKQLKMDLLSRDRVLYLVGLSIIILIGWSVYNSNYYGVSNFLEDVQRSIESFGKTSESPLATDPMPSYRLFNLVQYSLVIPTLLLGLVTGILLLKYRNTLYERGLISSIVVFGGMFVLTIAFIGASVFESVTFIQRGFMFMLISWVILSAIFMSLKIKRKPAQQLKGILVLFIVYATFAIPIARYGADISTYVPSSLAYLAAEDARASEDHRIMALTGNTVEIFKYQGAKNLINIKSQHLLYNDVKREAGELDPNLHAVNELRDWTIFYPNQKVVVSEHGNNVLILRDRAEDYLPTLERYLIGEHNLISSSGSARLYLNKPFF